MSLPLEGVRILAISQYGAGPFATLHLADLGAEIIKIEDPKSGGDVSRSIPPYAVEGDSLFFQSFNRSKKGVTLDLQSREGYDVFLDLVRVSDAVFNNLRGDLPAKLGVDYAALQGVKPAIVCCSLSGFGSSGPRAAEPGYDYLAQAEAGYTMLTGEPDSPPVRAGVSVIDFAAGYSAAMALLAGILQARATGTGCELQVSLIGTARSMLNYLAAWHLNRGYQPSRTPDSGHPSVVPCQLFPTKDGYLMVMCNKEKFWQNLCERLEAPEIRDDPRFRDFAARLEYRAELIPLLKERFRRRTTVEWLDLLRHEVPVAPVNDLATALEQAAAEPDGIVTVEHAAFGAVKLVGPAVRVPGTESVYRAAPALGEHNEDVLHNLLGYPPERIRSLRASGAI